MFISLGVRRVIDYFRETMETCFLLFFFKLRIQLMSHNDMWLACGLRGQFIHLSVLSRCTAVCVLVCQVQIDCESILMYSVALDRIYRHRGIFQDISGERRGYIWGETVISVERRSSRRRDGRGWTDRPGTHFTYTVC